MGEVPTALPGDGFCLPCSSSSLLAPALDGGPHEAGIKKEREHAGSNLRPSKIWERVTVTKMTASLSRCAPRRGARSSGPQQRRLALAGRPARSHHVIEASSRRP
ncbi:unnamed protein product [Prorocentrum cordatum]|uniref:Uncharacterized protein n=1 Tax=Prorocentrum cordatum TaxID=2364126 RepID=A0ABN9P8R4_9DINO|nr:unnamed protein product [Polarella glacialis]